MNIKNFFAKLWHKDDLKQRLEGYTVSALFHLILLFILATITISAGSEGFGLGPRPKGAKVQLAFREENISDTDLEELIEDVEIKPFEVERIKPRRVELPELPSFSAPRPSSERLTKISTRFSPAVSTGGLSGQFGSFIIGLRKSGLDIVIVIDATASMKYVIDDIKARVAGLVENIQALVPIARVGIVAFRDQGEQFSVKWTDLSFHASKIRTFIQNLEADGGGDYEEGVRQGLEAAIDELSWRKRSKRVIILVGSSPPHKEDVPAVQALAKEWKDTGGVLSAIDLSQRMHEEYEYKYHMARFGKPPERYSPLPKFYQDIRKSFRDTSAAGGGELASLGGRQELTEQILYFAFGSKWKSEVARYTAKK